MRVLIQPLLDYMRKFLLESQRVRWMTVHNIDFIVDELGAVNHDNRIELSATSQTS